MKLQNIIEEYLTTNKFRLIKRYRLMKEIRLLMDELKRLPYIHVVKIVYYNF